MRAIRSLTAVVLCLLAATSASAYEWRSLPQPAGRAMGSMTIVTRGHRAFLCGGGDGGSYMSDVWTLSLDTTAGLEWQRYQATGSLPERSAHAAIFDPTHNRLLVFGGKNSGGLRNDLWQLDLAAATWTDVTPSGGGPSPRWLLTAVYHPSRNSMIIFGGNDGANGLNDVWELDLDSLKWSQMAPSGTPPSGRWSYTAGLSLQLNKLIVRGGQSGSSVVGDEWTLDLTPGAEQWAPLVTSGNPPGARANDGVGMDQLGNKLVVFGGFDYPGYIRLYDNLNVLDLSTMVWSRLYPSGDAPAARRCATCVWDPSNSSFVMFSGQTDGGWPGELFYVNIDQMTSIAVGAQPRRTAFDVELPTVTRAPLVIRCHVRQQTSLQVQIVDAAGRVVVKLGPDDDGNCIWDGRDLTGGEAPAGAYFCKMQAGDESVSRGFRLVR
jgi:hypothetical protein